MKDDTTMFYGLAFVVVYFLPWIVAVCRGHHQRNAIAFMNALLGWTVVGWMAALIWSATAIRRYPTTMDPTAPTGARVVSRSKTQLTVQFDDPEDKAQP